MRTHSNRRPKIIKNLPSYNLITVDNLKNALFPLQISPQPRNPLESLMIVDRYIFDSMFPECRYSHKIALVEILNAIIVEELKRHREIMEIYSQEERISISYALHAISEDGKTGNPQLIGWSWLYYRCVRIELGITQQKFCETIFLNDRTIRRYQNLALDRMVQILVHMEWSIRRFNTWQTRASLHERFTQAQAGVILKLYSILETLRTDEELICAFATFLELEKKDGTFLPYSAQ